MAHSRSRSPLPAVAVGLAAATLTVTGVATGVATVAATSASAATATQAAAQTGKVRLAHLSPDTGPVDVALTAFGKGTMMMSAHNVAYGHLTAYQSMPAGHYTVTMRPAGSPSTAPALLSTDLTVSSGGAFTVAAEGPKKNLTEQVIHDDLSAPPTGRSKVRLIQAATTGKAVTVRAVGGPVLANAADYGTVTGYADVMHGPWSLKVQPTGTDAPAATPQVDLAAGSVTTLLVLNTPSGGVTVRATTDRAGASAMAVGGVQTGAGGAAQSSDVLLWLGALGLVGAAVVAGVGVTRRTRVQ